MKFSYYVGAMASESVLLESIKETQDNLGKFVEKPPYRETTEKASVNRNTGFFDGIFTPEELLSENVNERESKIYFLAKVIDVANNVTESSLTVKPFKVIAGLFKDGLCLA